MYISSLSDQTHGLLDLVTLDKVQGQFGLMMFSDQDMKSILVSAHSEAGDSQIVTTVKISIRCNGKLTKEHKQNATAIRLFVQPCE